MDFAVWTPSSKKEERAIRGKLLEEQSLVTCGEYTSNYGYMQTGMDQDAKEQRLLNIVLAWKREEDISTPESVTSIIRYLRNRRIDYRTYL